MTKAGDDLFLRQTRCQRPINGSIKAFPGIHMAEDFEVNLKRPLPGTAMHIAEHIDRRGHRAVDTNPAGHCHPRRGDGGRQRSVVDGGDKRCLKQGRLFLIGYLAAHHQPDHLNEAQLTNQALYRIAAQVDLARFHIDDTGLPPVTELRACVRLFAVICTHDCLPSPLLKYLFNEVAVISRRQ